MGRKEIDGKEKNEWVRRRLWKQVKERERKKKNVKQNDWARDAVIDKEEERELKFEIKAVNEKAWERTEKQSYKIWRKTKKKKTRLSLLTLNLILSSNKTPKTA